MKIKLKFILLNLNSKLMFMFKEFLHQLLDISDDDNVNDIHECLSLSSVSINNLVITHCMTLNHLHIHLTYDYFLEHSIEHGSALQTLSVIFKDF
ncbi:unnamed protein product [Rotaria sp. Silwood2]|nr:unnamed protein product [Rotaria sp. Silwood2]